MAKFGIGQALRRREDARFLTGTGQFTDDREIEGQAWVCFVRSPVPHARIAGIDVAAAEQTPGVVAVFTGKDVAADPGVRPMPCLFDSKDRHGKPAYIPPRPIMATDRTRFVGEPVAMVVAETEQAARDAAEAVMPEYDDLPFVTDAAAAAADGAPRIWDDCAGNVGIHWENGPPDEVAALFDNAPHVAEIEIVNNRVIANPLEPRCALADYDPETDATTLYCPSQGVHRMFRVLAGRIFDLPKEKLRIVSNDVGGGFGVRSKTYPEQALLVWASRRLRRALKWRGDRSESMLSDNHARDHVSKARLALDAEGRVQALWIETVANMGAYMFENAPGIPTVIGQRSTGTVYRIPALYHSVRCVFTNTVPLDSYRGAGRPETVYLMERLMDAAARVARLDAVEIRRRNLVPADAMPYRNAMGLMIDSGDFPAALDMALAEAGWSGFDARRADAAKQGRLRGIGVACSLECSGGAPEEEARIRLTPDGGAVVYAGTFPQGQAHETVFPQVAAELLGLDYERIEFIPGGDTAVVADGFGTSASRSAHMGGNAVAGACERIIAAVRPAAGQMLQADPEALRFEGGLFHAPDGGSIGLAEAAATLESPPDETYRFKREPGVFMYPNGCHIAEVEVEPETGSVEIVRYTAVDDNGVVLNPMIVHGQVHGAVAQGIGQALMENTWYDRDTGQLFTVSFMDYALPRADQIPCMSVHNIIVPCKTDVLGVKGAGESGCCAAPPAVVGAVADALKHLGIHHIDMPLTPERVWRAIRDARVAGA